MTTDDEAVAAAIDPRPQDGEPLDDYYSTPTRHLIAASDRIRALSARVAELNDQLTSASINRHYTWLEQSERADAAEAKLLEIDKIADTWGDRATPFDPSIRVMMNALARIAIIARGARAALAHTATQPEATPGKGEG